MQYEGSVSDAEMFPQSFRDLGLKANLAASDKRRGDHDTMLARVCGCLENRVDAGGLTAPDAQALSSSWAPKRTAGALRYAGLNLCGRAAVEVPSVGRDLPRPDTDFHALWVSPRRMRDCSE